MWSCWLCHHNFIFLCHCYCWCSCWHWFLIVDVDFAVGFGGDIDVYADFFPMILRGKIRWFGSLVPLSILLFASQKERERCLSPISKWNRKIIFDFQEILVENEYKRKTFLHLLRGGGAFLYPLMNTEDGGFLKTAKWLKTLLSTNLPSYIWLFLLESFFCFSHNCAQDSLKIPLIISQIRNLSASNMLISLYIEFVKL